MELCSILIHWVRKNLVFGLFTGQIYTQSYLLTFLLKHCGRYERAMMSLRIQDSTLLVTVHTLCELFEKKHEFH